MGEINSGKADVRVMQTLVKNMRQFDEIVTAEIDRMRDRANRLGSVWKDEQYKKFDEYIEQLGTSLKNELRIVHESAVYLQKKIDDLLS